MRNRESVHKLWVALTNQSFGDVLANSSKRGGPIKAATYSDLAKSSIKKNCEIFGKLLIWFKDTVDFTDSEDTIKLKSFATGLILQTSEELLAVGAVFQSELDGLTCIG